VSVVGTSNETVYEKMIKPDNPIVDYNTEYAEITSDNLMHVYTNTHIGNRLFDSKLSCCS